MTLRLVPPRKGNPNWQVRGSYLHAKRFYRSAGTPDRALAEQVLLKFMKDIENGFLASVDHETWRPIPGCRQYEVSKNGYVRHRSRGHALTAGALLKPTAQRYGHLSVTVYRDDGTPWRASVHRLVALAFIGPPPSPQHLVCHKNGYAEELPPRKPLLGNLRR